MSTREHSVRCDAKKVCAETRDRTGDLQIFSLTLSQLSYRGCCPRATTGETHGRRSNSCKEAAALISASQDARPRMATERLRSAIDRPPKTDCLK